MGMNQVSKRDFYNFNQREVDAGRRAWSKAGLAGRGEDNQHGRMLGASIEAEDTAPKTWLMFKNSHIGEAEAIVECELYITGRDSSSDEAVSTLHGMCPKCSETFLVREDNKQMTLEWVPYLKTRGHLKEQWERHCREKLRRAPRSDDKIASVSSPERWACDYCHGWCVKVTDSIAITDMSGVTQLVVPQGATIGGDRGASPAPETKSEIIL